MVDAADDGELPWAWRELEFTAANRSQGSFLPQRLQKEVKKWNKSYKAVVHTMVHDCQIKLGALDTTVCLYFGLGSIYTSRSATRQVPFSSLCYGFHVVWLLNI